MPPRDRTKRRVIPKQKRAQASAEAILTAAEQLLREHGFARLTTNRIAKRAGVNVALVYRYFAGKEAIVAALIERFARLTFDIFRETLLAHETAPLPVMVRALLEVLVETPEPKLHRELFEHIDLAKQRELVRVQSRAMTSLAAEALARRGAELQMSRDPAARLFVLEHVVFAVTHAAAFYRPPELALTSVLDELSDVVCRTLRADSSLPAAPRCASQPVEGA